MRRILLITLLAVCLALTGVPLAALAGPGPSPVLGQGMPCCHAQAQPVLSPSRGRCCCPMDAPCNMEPAPKQPNPAMHFSQPTPPPAPAGQILGHMGMSSRPLMAGRSQEPRRPPAPVPIYLRIASLLI